MLHIETDKIWKLIKKDSEIHQKLLQYLEDEEKHLNEAKERYKKQMEIIYNLEQKREDIKKQIAKDEGTINNKNGAISLLEFKRLFALGRIRKLKRSLFLILSPKKRKKYKKLIEREIEKLGPIEEKQSIIKDEISEVLKTKEKHMDELKDMNYEINQNYDYLKEEEKAVSIWKESMDMKVARFYQSTFENVTENFEPCQNLVVKDLEEKKKMTKKDAKEKANPIIIDEEYILSSPEDIKVRTLKKDEREEYRKSA